MLESPSIEVASSLFDSMKSFIVLGLCGRTGSGCTEAANILGKDFCDLHLPQPPATPGSSIQSAEELILYNYAEKNWVPFYQIKTSCLMTGYLLEETDRDAFIRYLKALFPDNKAICENKSIQTAFDVFYDSKMEFLIPEYFVEKIRADYGKDAENILEGLFGFLTEKEGWSQLFPKDGTIPSAAELLKCTKKEEPYSFTVKDKDDSYPFEYSFQNRAYKVTISLRDMQRLLNTYEYNRRHIQPMGNDLIYGLLYEYVYHALPRETKKFWKEIRNVQRGLPTIIMQDIGINLRTWVRPMVYKDNMPAKVEKDGFLTIAKRINLCLKVLRDYLQRLKEFRELLSTDPEKYQKSLRSLDKNTQQVMVVIDSIKNPFESMYLKARYSSYYLVAVSTDDEERYARLEKAPKQLTFSEIGAIDTIELLSNFKKFAASEDGLEKGSETTLSVYSLQKIKEKLNGDFKKIFPFVMQNLERCIETADIFIYNRRDNDQRLLLKRNLVRYISLIMNPGLVLPTDIERCMQIAQTAKVNSGCISRQVGAVLTDRYYRVRSVGWNEVPSGRVPCTYRDIFDVSRHWSPEAYSDFENDDNDEFQKRLREISTAVEQAHSCMSERGKRVPYCFKDAYNEIDHNKNQVHPRALHGEERAFLDLADQGGESIKGGYLFTTSSPCELCSKKACYMGISKVYYVESYAGLSAKHVMSDGSAGQRPVQELFTGALGRAYTYLYTPILPKKDELEMWLCHNEDRSSLDATDTVIETTEAEAADQTPLSSEEPGGQPSASATAGYGGRPDEMAGTEKGGRAVCRLLRKWKK